MTKRTMPFVCLGAKKRSVGEDDACREERKEKERSSRIAEVRGVTTIPRVRVAG